MRWPINPDHNQSKLRVYQTIMVPRPKRKFVFTRVPGGSYAKVGEVYTCSGYPTFRWYQDNISLTNVERGSGTYDSLPAWEHAEWHYVDGEGEK